VHIPGVLTVFEPRPADAVPVLVDSPHSGRDYPADFLPVIDHLDYAHCEDRLVDQLIAGFPALGATMLCAHAPRIFIDLNRARNDINRRMLSDAWTGDHLRPSGFSTSGIGLIWQFIDRRPLYPQGIPSAEVQRRIADYYDPYYQTLKIGAAQLESRFGRFYHLNMHSMPTHIPADIVLGNQHHQSCSREFMDVLENAFRDAGISRIAINKPYAGAELTRVFSHRTGNGESVQIEINRGLYLDGLEAHPEKFGQMQTVLNKVLLRMADYASAPKTSVNVSRIAASRSSMETRFPSAASDVTP